MHLTQFGALLERLAVVATSYAIGAGYVAPEDEQSVAALAVAVVSGGLALYNSRQKRLAERASAAGMLVVAPEKIAATTRSPRIFSDESVDIVHRLCGDRCK